MIKKYFPGYCSVTSNGSTLTFKSADLPACELTKEKLEKPVVELVRAEKLKSSSLSLAKVLSHFFPMIAV